MRRPWSGIGLAALLVTTGALGACKPKESGTDTTAAIADTAREAAARTDSAANAAAANAGNGGWSDAKILAFTAAANNGEINEGKLAQTKATNAQVKAFARQLVSDHQTMLREGRTFASAHNVTPDTANGDVRDLVKDSRDEVKDLTDKKAGADWDKEFLDKQIGGHKDVLDKLQDAAKSTNDAALRTMLTKASGKVQEHLTKAQALKDKYPAS